MTKPKVKRFCFSVTEGLVGLRLDKALSNHPEIESRSQATSLIDHGCVTINGNAVKPARKTVLGECYEVILQLLDPLELLPYEYPLDVVYEDDDLLVVNKPSGLVVHPAAGHYTDTLVNALLYHTNHLASGFSAGRPGIVHRLDKETSGLLVVAKNDSALRSLAHQFKKKSVHRIYWAVTYGHFRRTAGTITSSLRRHPTDRKRFASERLSPQQEPQGKLAVTHYVVKSEHPSGLSLVHCTLETGRTHQIRVHLSEAGHPIVADPLYCSGHRLKSIRSTAMRALVSAAPHLMLHAAELGFIHPRLKKELKFSAPWPPETHALLQGLSFL